MSYTFDLKQEPDALVAHVRICAGGLPRRVIVTARQGSTATLKNRMEQNGVRSCNQAFLEYLSETGQILIIYSN
jgi:hypothetical protein